ncbi:MAG: TonB-dependent receptor plug domain-containing protein [Flavobacteriales bacterium]|nr:TonB-dependent receptor plug domain-containing protein [Flavobacteriales bacterium]
MNTTRIFRCKPVALWVLLISTGLQQMHAQFADSTNAIVPLVLLPEAQVSVGTSFDDIAKTDAPKATAILSASELESTVSVTDALEYVTGVDIQNRGAWGIQSDVSIRGGTFEQTALLVNGMRWSAPHTGHHLMNIPIDPEDLSHVEVVRSGSGAMAGAGAFAGSIHLRTNTPVQETAASASIEGGSFGWNRLRLHADIVDGGFRQRISLSRAQTNGHILNSDAQITRAMWNADWSNGPHRWNGLVALEDKAFGAQNFYTSTYPDQFEVTKAAVAQLNWETQSASWKASAGAHARYHRDRFELYREGSDWYELTDDGFYVRPPLAPSTQADTAGIYAPGASWYTGANQHRSLTGAVNAKFQWFGEQSTWTTALDVREEVIQSNRLGSAQPGAPEVFPLGDRRTNLDGFTSWKWVNSGNNMAISATAGVNGNSRFGWRALPSADVRYRFGQDGNWVAFASAGRSVRHPSFTELYYTVGGAMGSDSLKPEWADQAEVGVRWSSEPNGFRYWIMVEGSAFVRSGENLIDWVKYLGSEVYQATNLSATEFRGGDLAITIKSMSGLLRSVRLSGTWLDANRESEGAESVYVLNFLKYKLDAVTEWKLPSDVGLAIRYSYQERRAEETPAPIHLLGLTLKRSWGSDSHIHTSFRVENVLDQQYMDLGQVLQPGMHFRLGLTFDIRGIKPSSN